VPASEKISVLVLGGGPDAERDVSIKSATAIADALKAAKRFDVHLETIAKITPQQLAGLPGDVIFPYLHGPWGEGGPLQDIIELDHRPFVGSHAGPSRLAMDKIATKLEAARHAIPTAPAAVLNTRDRVSPFPFPVVVKPIHEGSTIGLSICADGAAYELAIDGIIAEQTSGLVRPYMVEPRIGGAGEGAQARELTVGLLDGRALPVIEIVPKEGLYDYNAKYVRDDTRYLVEGVDLHLDGAIAARVKKDAEKLAAALHLRHVARADFMLDHHGQVWLLEINTTPGFTDHSLVPKAAKAAGLDMPHLCARLVDMALRDRKRR
jgi:D-alanine-D-alanine ligase